ncbi:MAG TPA: porphobilinogen synthase [Actinomycetota bacterium]|nr:porphobilinogen synthase [Actinomycetota bacterium]
MERRLRRLRRSEGVRRLLSETRLDPSRFVLPIFVTNEADDRSPIHALPGHMQWPARDAGIIAKEAESVGIPGVLIFGVTSKKDDGGTEAHSSDGAAQIAIREIKSTSPDLVVFSDVCLCGYTSHGHCGVVSDGDVDNDATVEILAEIALSHASCGADFVSPSDMMDGRVAAIRTALDTGSFADTGIMAYSAKFASAFYGPFREAADCAPSFGDRRSYQIDPADGRQAMAAIRRDVAEGADIVMVKPALAYLDVIKAARSELDIPISAYNVSGEFAMVKAAAEKGLIDEKNVTLETLTSITRAGADFIITYHALEAARWLQG